MDLQLLYSLVHSLTEKEQKRCADKFDNEQSILFELLMNFPHYDFNAITKEMQSHNIHNSLGKELFNIIIASESDRQINPKKKAKDLFNKTSWLFQRGQYHLCSIFLDQTKSIARKYELLDLLVDISVMEYNLEQIGVIVTTHSPSHNYIYYSDQSHNLRQFVAMKLKLRSMGLIVENPESKKIRFLLQDTLLASESKALSVKAKFLYNELRAKLLFLLEDYLAAFEAIKRLLELYDENVHFLEVSSEASRYIANMANFLKITDKLGLETQKVQQMVKFRELSEKYGFDKGSGLAGQLHTISYCEEITKNYQAAQFDNILGLIPEITSYFKDGTENYKVGYKFIIYSYFVKTLFVNEFYEEALTWANHILGSWQKVAGNDLKSEILQLKMLIYVELEKYEALEELVKEMKQFLQTSKRRSQHEMLVLNLMKSITKIPKSDLSPVFKEYQLYISAVIDELPIKHKQNIFDFVAWLESKLQNVSLIEVLKEKSRVVSNAG